MFTIIQLTCVGAFWGVKYSPASLAYPFVLILLVLLRQFIFKHIFSVEELNQVTAQYLNLRRLVQVKTRVLLYVQNIY